MVAESTEARALVNQESTWPPARVIQWLATVLVVTIAEIAFFAGHPIVSYLLDAAAVAIFFGLRRAREHRA